MGFTPLFLEMRRKKVVVIGTGEVGSRRARRFEVRGRGCCNWKSCV